MGFFNFSNENNECQDGGTKIVAFINQKGGVGKTTLAYNTARALVEQGKKVLCIDMDPQSNLTLLFGKEDHAEENIFQLLINSVRELKSLHTPCMVGDAILKKEGMDLLPASQDLSGFELMIAGISAPRQLILKKFIEKNGLRDLYDVIIIDSPPTLGLLVVNILCSSDGVMVPFRPDDFSKVGLTHFYNVLEDIEEMGIVKTPQVIAHIPNLVDSRRKQEVSDLEIIEHDSIERVEGVQMATPFYNRSQLVKSLAQKKSVFEYHSKEFSPLRKKFSELAQMIDDFSH